MAVDTEENKGRTQHRSKTTTKQPKVVNFGKLYGQKLPPFDPNSQRFRYTMHTGKGQPGIPLGHLIQTAEWRDEGTLYSINAIPVLQGSLTLTKPDPAVFTPLDIRRGYSIVCEVTWGQHVQPANAVHWIEVWRMRVQKITTTVQDGTVQVELADPLVVTSKSSADFRFKKDKHHPHGWRYDQIVHSVCRQFRIPLLTLVKGRKHIASFNQTQISPLEAIRLAVEEEVIDTSTPLQIGWRYDRKRRRSGLSVSTLRRNPVLYTFDKQIREADVTRDSIAELATAITIYSSSSTKNSKGKSKGKRTKFVHREVDEEAVKQFGYIEKRLDISGSVSPAAAQERAKRELAKRVRPMRLIENMTHSGVAFLRRGDAVHVEIPEEGYHGIKPVYKIVKSKRKKHGRRHKKKVFVRQADGLVFVISITHTASAGDYYMTMELGLKDLIDAAEQQAAQDAADRRKKAAKQKKKTTKKSHH